MTIQELQKEADLIFLSLCIWREARGQADNVQAGVAYSILNRVKHPGWWGRDVTGVVFAKWQYSSMTDPHDPQLVVWPLSTDTSWQGCMEIAQGVLDGSLPNPVGEADSYYDLSIPAPKWATPQNFVTQLGKIRFHTEVNKEE